MNHKRKRPKHQRAGCLLCKSYKDERGGNSPDAQRPSIRRKLQDEGRALADREEAGR